MSTCEVVVSNIFSKYDNPIAEIVHISCKYSSSIHAMVENRSVNLKSIMGIMAVKWDEGMKLAIQAEGSDEKEAVEALKDFLA